MKQKSNLATEITEHTEKSKTQFSLWTLLKQPAIRLPLRHGARMRLVREEWKSTAPAIGCYAVTCRGRYPQAGKSLLMSLIGFPDL